MGSDAGPSLLVRAACAVLQDRPDVYVYLVGNERHIRPVLQAIPNLPPSRYCIVHADDVVDMNDRPSVVLRQKRNSSLARAVDLLAQDRADGLVSGGHTGALMACAKVNLSLCPHIERPAITTVLPSSGGFTRVIDLGANIECHSEMLFQFGLMGGAIANAIDGHEMPRIGLLNVGAESGKGSDNVKRAAELLQSCPQLNYVGFVEGHDIFQGQVDVVVCDGFTGNAVLKAAEGLSMFFAELVQTRLLKGMKGSVLKWLLAPRLRKLRNEINPDRYNGASLAGLGKVVIKSHGHANLAASRQAIEEAVRQIENEVPQKVWQALETFSTGEV
jgi:glycerol-3-phosphate acyltransferase PlsX